MLFFCKKFVSDVFCIKFALALSKAGLWCNGNTTVFGAVFLGSSPSRPTKNPLNLRGFFVYMNFDVIYILKVTTGRSA